MPTSMFVASSDVPAFPGKQNILLVIFDSWIFYIIMLFHQLLNVHANIYCIIYWWIKKS